MTRSLRPSSSSTTPPPLPPSPLPNELKRSILAFADTQTLARCCRVNLALLEIASELLYREVEVDGFERLERMFCTREARPSSSSAQVVDNSLYLHRIRTFTFLADAWPSYEDQPKFLLDRQHHRLLEVDVLTIKPPPDPIPGLPDDHEFNARSLLLPFNPTAFNFIVPSSFGEACCHLILTQWEGDSLPISSPSWTRLSALRLVNSADRYPLVFPSTSWTTTYELSNPFSADSGPHSTLYQIGTALEEPEGFTDGVLRYPTVVVQSEEEKTRVDAFLRWECGLGEDRMKAISLVVGKISV